MLIICLMVRENHKMVREKSGNFVRAHGWTPWIHIWYKWYWYNHHFEQYNISNKIHINLARSQPYPNPKYISFNNGIRGDNNGTFKKPACHYSDVIMITMTSQITGVLIVYSTVCSGTDQSSASLAIVRGIHRWLGNSPYKGPVKRKMFPFDDVIMDLASFA